MPHSLVVNFIPKTPIYPEYLTGRHIHALFLTLVSSVDKELGDRLHGDKANKGFGLSPILVMGNRSLVMGNGSLVMGKPKPKTRSTNPQSPIPNYQLPIPNPQSPIPNYQSPITKSPPQLPAGGAFLF